MQKGTTARYFLEGIFHSFIAGFPGRIVRTFRRRWIARRKNACRSNIVAFLGQNFCRLRILIGFAELLALRHLLKLFGKRVASLQKQYDEPCLRYFG